MAILRVLKWVAGIFISLVVIYACLLIWVLMGMAPADLSKEEIARVASPSRNMEAVLLEVSGDASTTGFSYWVYVVAPGTLPSGSPLVSLSAAISNQGKSGANLQWVKSDLVAIEYWSAKSVMVNAKTQRVGDQLVHIALREGFTGNAIPSVEMDFHWGGGPK